MLITTGQVRGGAIEVDGSSLPEGTSVTILVHEGDETFELTAEDENSILAAVAEADAQRNELDRRLDEMDADRTLGIPWDQVLKQIREHV